MSNLMVRLFWLLLRLRFLPRVAPFDTVRLPLRAWFNDIDFNWHVNNSRYLAFMDLGRVQMLGQTGVLREVVRRHWTPVAQAVEIRFIRDIKPLQRFELRTQLVGWDEKYWYIEQSFHSGNTVHAVAFARGLFLERGHKVAPAEVAALMGHSPESPPLPPAVERWRALREAL